MPKSAFEPCIPTRGTKVPDRPEWIHEIKHDGYRLIVQRDGQRVRLFTRNCRDGRNRNAHLLRDGRFALTFSLSWVESELLSAFGSSICRLL